MPFDWPAIQQKAADHLATLYAVPGFKGHALHQLHHLDRNPVWAGLIDRVPAEMQAELARLRAKKGEA